MSDKHTLIAFCSVLAAVVTLALIAAFKGTQTDLAIMTGLIGVLGTFRPRGSTANVEQADTVNQAAPTE